MKLNNENQLWKISDGKIQPLNSAGIHAPLGRRTGPRTDRLWCVDPLNSDFSLGITMDDTVGVFDPDYLNSFIEYPRELRLDFKIPSDWLIRFHPIKTVSGI